MQQFDQYVKLNKKIPPEILTSIPASMIQAAWPIRLLRIAAQAGKQAGGA
jgi:hypothetical protein